ncbi:hypothetical protein [Streptomyces coeruleorubidus]|uniref:hypothetical protein n=1 Tax=Streptomyces coeruleorubidus TaxID=116188 RepID=UPI0034117AC4
MFSGPRAIRRGAGRRLLRRMAVTAALLLIVTGCGGAGGDDSRPRSTRWQLDHVSTSPDTSVMDIAAASRDEGWALGRDVPEDGTGAYFLLHRQGSTWKRAEMPLRPEKGAEFANTYLEASGPDNVWLFASQIGEGGFESVGTPAAVRWDGRKWRTTSVDFSVSDVVVLAPDDVWALDADTAADLRHWDGERWTSHDLPDEANALSGTGPDDVWAVGFRDDQPATMHFDGKKWRSVPTPGFRPPGPQLDGDASLSDVVAVSRDDAWAFGTPRYWTDDAELHETALALHWNGKRWRKAPKAIGTALQNNPELGTSGTRDGAGGFVLSGGLHHTADGTLHTIKKPKPVAGRSGKITKADRRQRFQVSDLQLVPGTHEIWAAGNVSVERGGDANFMRGVIASYSTGG